MAYTAIQLINNAFYLSKVVSREFQEVQGYQVNDGLGFLNDILADKVVQENMLPYYTIKQEFNAIPGQQTYFIENLISVETLVFFIQDIRYSMQPVKRDQYWGTSRAENIESLPVTYNFERKLGGANINLYFLPDQAYLMQLTGLYRLPVASLNQDLSQNYDQFYITYLRYALASRICMEYSFSVPPNVQQQLEVYEGWISNKSASLDLKLNFLSTFTANDSINYAQANLGHGWTVPG